MCVSAAAMAAASDAEGWLKSSCTWSGVVPEVGSDVVPEAGSDVVPDIGSDVRGVVLCQK